MLTAFFVMLREGFEAALIVAILYAYLRKVDRQDLVPTLWAGIGAAAVLAIGSGVVIKLTVDTLEGDARLRAFAAISIFAVVVLTWMIFWMRKHARAIRGELQHSMDRALSTRRSITWAVAAAAFFAVLREGLEAVLFMIATATTEDSAEVLIGAVAGLAVASLMGYLVVLGGRRMPMRQFFTVTGVMLIVFAAGLLSRSVLFLQSSGDLATAWNNVYDVTGVRWLTTRTEFGRFLGAMFGWDPRPSIEQIVAYVTYAATVTYLFLRRPRATAKLLAEPGQPPVGARVPQAAGEQPARSGKVGEV